MVLSERFTVPVPNGLRAQDAALTEPMAVGLHAVNKAKLDKHDACIVIGCGPVGLAIITVLKSHGYGPIVAADFSAARRQFAAAQGADLVVDPTDASPFDAADLKGREVVVFECVGVPGILDDVFVRAAANTRIVVVGVCLQTDHIRPLIAINKELALQFVLGYSVEEFTDSLTFIADGKFDVASLISHEIGLEDVSRAFDQLKDPDAHAKVIVRPEI